MAEDPTGQPATPRELLIFFAKLAAYMIGLGAFGFAIFTLRRMLG